MSLFSFKLVKCKKVRKMKKKREINIYQATAVLKEIQIKIQDDTIYLYGSLSTKMWLNDLYMKGNYDPSQF